MTGLLIVKPAAPVAYIAAGGGAALAARLMRPNPKEAVIIPPGGTFFAFDFGVAVSFDSVFVGYHSGGPDGTSNWAASRCDANGANPDAALTDGTRAYPVDDGTAPRHAFYRRAAAIASRYWRIDFTNAANAPSYYVGTLAFGLAFEPSFGAEFGAGRLIEDTGTAERLMLGSFGIDEGVAAPGYQWTFGDLSNEETRQLWRLAKDRRTTRSLLVVESDAYGDPLNERLHWGLLRKLEAYERVDPRNTRWAMQVQDWA